MLLTLIMPSIASINSLESIITAAKKILATAVQALVSNVALGPAYIGINQTWAKVLNKHGR